VPKLRVVKLRYGGSSSATAAGGGGTGCKQSRPQRLVCSALRGGGPARCGSQWRLVQFGAWELEMGPCRIAPTTYYLALRVWRAVPGGRTIGGWVLTVPKRESGGTGDGDFKAAWRAKRWECGAGSGRGRWIVVSSARTKQSHTLTSCRCRTGRGQVVAGGTRAQSRGLVAQVR